MSISTYNLSETQMRQLCDLLNECNDLDFIEIFETIKFDQVLKILDYSYDRVN